MTRPEAVEMDQMKTDRELLELAAKAAGVDLKWQSGWNGMPDIASFCGAIWNPLANDGDALRLAVKCDIDIDQFHDFARADYMIGCGIRSIDEPSNGDQCKATRRAIVRAAAAIGEAMP